MVLVSLTMGMTCRKRGSCEERFNLYGYHPVPPPYSQSAEKAISTAVKEFIRIDLDTSGADIEVKEDSVSYLVEYIPYTPPDEVTREGHIVLHLRKGAMVFVEKGSYEIVGVCITK